MTRSLTLYDTMSRAKQRFEPIDPHNVRMYVCGPTVYDLAHIGNARPVIVFDVLFRLLRHLYGEDHVRYVRNVTDVDDKINARAVESFPDLPPTEAIRRLTEATNAQFQADVAALGCLEPSEQPRATEHIADMVTMIARLVERGFAYEAEGHVLFHVPAMADYGRLSRRSLDDMIAGARVDVAPYKRDPQDFVLWKPSSESEPGWPSPWGRGRPGWHIECSAMSLATLLRPYGGGFDCDDPARNAFDIHGGGIDLVFPHHENEIAQSCCALGTPRMANIWMHNGFLQVEGEKMSKSLGNFLTIADLLKDWPGEVLRFNMLKTHYRQPIDWKLDRLLLSAEELSEWACHFLDGGVMAQVQRARMEGAQPDVDPRVLEPLLDDLDTPGAMAGLYRLGEEARADAGARPRLFDTLEFLGLVDMKTVGALVRHVSGNAPAALLARHRHLVARVQAAVANRDHEAVEAAVSEVAADGLTFSVDARNGSVELNRSDAGSSGDGKVERLIADRLAARQARNFAESDRIRDELAAMGIALKDGKDADGQPTTTWEVKR